MREIKFRGKRKDGNEWLYGDLNHIDGRLYVIDDFDKPANWFEVDPETVGQYTGLKDVKGNEIYDGDILKEDGHGVFEVVWESKQCKFSLDWTRTSPSIQYPGWNRGIRMEIIGNIHDNPDLLK